MAKSQDRRTLAFYTDHAAEYAAETARLSMSPLLRTFADLSVHAAHVLDLGCGAGRDLLELSEMGLEPVGLDLSLPLASYAHKHSSAPVVVGDMRQLPFAKGSFRGVWASASLLHISRSDIGIALSECRRVLGTNGLFFSSVKAGSSEGRDQRGRFFSYFSLPEWSQLVRRAGFSVLLAEEKPAGDARARSDSTVSWINAFARAE